jgi:malonyl-CoA/methylmalonyl-CoA synthetase
MKMQSFVELLRAQFEQNADKHALVHRDKPLTFGQLELHAERVGASLRTAGMQKGDRVILYMPQKLPFLLLHLGIILNGGVSLPLNFAFTAEEMLYYLNDSSARFVFATGDQANRIDSIKDRCPQLKAVLNPNNAISGDRCTISRQTTPAPSDDCFMLYSSGTTGKPKGVVHTHQNLAASLIALKTSWRFTSDDVLLNVLPLFHIHGLSFAAHLSLISGSTMLMEDRFHPLKTMDRIGDATVFMAVPTLYYAFLRRREFREKAKHWQKVRLFTCGSAPIRPEVLPELESILNAPLINRYGMTESHVITSLPLDGPFPRGSVGLPLDGIDLKLVAEDGTDPSAPMGVGEVKIRGKNLFDRYWNRPDASDDDLDPQGFFATGDLGYLDANGFLTLVGRKKDLIICSGLNVYPPVVEAVLNSFPQVREAAVIGVADALRGEKVVAVLVPEGEIDINELQEHCKKRLAHYQIPTRYELIDALPRNTMGKILKRVLKDKLDNEGRQT